MPKTYDPAELEEVGERSGRTYDPAELEEVPAAPAARPSARDVAASQLGEPGEASSPMVEATGPGGIGTGMRVGADVSKAGEEANRAPTDEQVEARRRGAIETASYGAADEAVGLLRAVRGKGKGDFWERRQAGRQAYRQRTEELRTRHPDDFTAGQVVGALAQPSAAGLVRGGGAAALAGRAAIGAGESIAAGALGSDEGLTARGAAADGAVGLLAAVPAMAGTRAKSGKAERAMLADWARSENAAEKDAIKEALGKSRVKTAVSDMWDKLKRDPVSAITGAPFRAIDVGAAEGRKALDRSLGQLSKLARSGKPGAPVAQLAQELLAAGATEREVRLALGGVAPGGDE